jgi:CubicO group peptidase (beta-lactamase class C family)
MTTIFGALLLLLPAQDAASFPPPEDAGGWRTLLPASGDPDVAAKARIRGTAGVDWDKLAEAWAFNAQVEGASGLLVIRKGWIAGEWYKDGDAKKAFNIYSSSKAYTSAAYGILLAEHPKLTLETNVCTEEWLPEALPLTDPRKSGITLRHLLNMASGLGAEAVPAKQPFEWSLGKVEGSPMATLKGEPGKVFNYSNAGVAHLVLLFRRAAGRDLFPFMKDRVFDPIGMKQVTWQPLGGDGALGPLSQGYSGVTTTPREHARFCRLALAKGEWAGKRVVPAAHYDFAWKGIDVKPEYGAQWWVHPRHPQGPKDLVQTAGARNNHGYVVPSLDLIVVRLGDGSKFPKDWEKDFVLKVLAAVVP